jgi:nucleoside-diphosphate-sugar epimerase
MSQEPARPALFITGSSGFVGKRLLQQIDPAEYSRITLLNRRIIDLPNHLAGIDTVRQMVGTLNEPELYSAALDRHTRIIHLAGITGKAARDAYFETNTRGTEQLIHAAEQAGVHGFLFVSSIAVSFKARDGYYYAESKQQAERVLQSSRLSYCIVRPAMILGEGSPVLKNLSALASGPVIFQPGNGRAKAQPIDVGDLSRLLLAIVAEDAFANNVLEFGGPEVITVGDLLQKIHMAYHDKPGIVIRLPLGLLIFVFRMLENIIGKYLPATSGQFASFCNSGTVQPNAWWNRRSGSLKKIDSMLAGITAARKVLDDDPRALECSVYTRYLVNQEPDSYIQRKYAQAFAAGKPLAGACRSRFEFLLARISTIHPIYARAVDGYCKMFLRDSMIRKKMVLLLAILECRSGTARIIDHPDAYSPPLLLLTFLTQITRSIALLLIATLLLSPLRLTLNCADRLSGAWHG